jgi:hypothetical protein
MPFVCKRYVASSGTNWQKSLCGTVRGLGSCAVTVRRVDSVRDCAGRVNPFPGFFRRAYGQGSPQPGPTWRGRPVGGSQTLAAFRSGGGGASHPSGQSASGGTSHSRKNPGQRRLNVGPALRSSATIEDSPSIPRPSLHPRGGGPTGAVRLSITPLLYQRWFLENASSRKRFALLAQDQDDGWGNGAGFDTSRCQRSAIL